MELKSTKSKAATRYFQVFLGVGSSLGVVSFGFGELFLYVNVKIQSIRYGEYQPTWNKRCGNMIVIAGPWSFNIRQI